MKTTCRIVLAAALFCSIFMLVQGSPLPVVPDKQPTIKFTKDDHAGRDLYSWETDILWRAIDSIASPPPDSITFTQADGRPWTMACRDIALQLGWQLSSGRIQAETGPLAAAGSDYGGAVLSDGSTSPSGDQMNLNPALISAMSNPNNFPALAMTMVHEWVHKTQPLTGVWSSSDAREKEAWAAAWAYLDSIHVSADSILKLWDKIITFSHIKRAQGEDKTVNHLINAGDHWCGAFYDTTGLGQDTFVCFQLMDTMWHPFALSPFRASDFLIYPNCPWLPPDHYWAVISGGVPDAAHGQFVALDIFEGEVVQPPFIVDFGPPDFSPMYFHSFTRWGPTNSTCVMDTLGNRVLRISDSNGDDVPDQMEPIYADGGWPGFEALQEMQGVSFAHHPVLGDGLILHPDDMHFSHTMLTDEVHPFLPDADGDFIADALLLVPAWEFVELRPCIVDDPLCAGQTSVELFATWTHTIEVWASDSTGEALYEMLGVTLMADGAHAACPLTRALNEGEYVISVDMETGDRLFRATPVVFPSPQHLTIAVGEGIIQLRWDEVGGATSYNLYMSSDAVNYELLYEDIPTNSIVLAPFPDSALYFRVTAVR